MGAMIAGPIGKAILSGIGGGAQAEASQQQQQPVSSGGMRIQQPQAPQVDLGSPSGLMDMFFRNGRDYQPWDERIPGHSRFLGY